jgi:hypothetical protein
MDAQLDLAERAFSLDHIRDGSLGLTSQRFTHYGAKRNPPVFAPPLGSNGQPAGDLCDGPKILPALGAIGSVPTMVRHALLSSPI